LTDPTGMAPEGPDDWIKINGSYMYDEDIKSQEDAWGKYGHEAKYVGETHVYKAAAGGRVRLEGNGGWRFLGESNQQQGIVGAEDLNYSSPVGEVSNSGTPSQSLAGAASKAAPVIGTLDALSVSVTTGIQSHMKTRGISGLVGEGLTKSQVQGLKYGPFTGSNVIGLSKAMSVVGSSAAAFGYLSTANSFANGNISAGRGFFDASVTTYSWRGGAYGAAVGFGYGVLGPLVTSTQTYQNWKRDTWLPYRNRVFNY